MSLNMKEFLLTICTWTKMKIVRQISDSSKLQCMEWFNEMKLNESIADNTSDYYEGKWQSLTLKMSAILEYISEGYQELLDIPKDPMVETWPLMGSRTIVPLLVISYLYFVLSFGPEYMKNKQPFQLKTPLMLYNGALVLYSLYLVATFPFNVFGTVFSNCQNPYLENYLVQNKVHRYVWWAFLSKVVELLDTVFFILRKKNNQVSFLHIYHHANMVFMTWIFLKYLPASQYMFIGLINSMVHAIMYGYYFIAALGPKYQKYIWWKKYVTTMQIGQFYLLMAYFAVLPFFNCKYSKIVCLVSFTNTASFLILFLDFYRKTYKNAKKIK